MEKYELAEQDYIQGMKYKDIAAKYSVTLNTVKSWKTRYQWIRGPGGNEKEKKKSVHTKEKSVHTKEKDEEKDDFGLSERERLFAVYFMKSHNATRAYQKVYQCSYETAAVNASRKLQKANIQEFLKKIREQQYRKIDLTEDDIIQRYVDIAYADPIEYVDRDGLMKEGLEDGTLISNIIPTKFGPRVVMPDKMKALEKLQQYLDTRSETEEKEEAATIVIAPRIKHGDMDTTAETV